MMEQITPHLMINRARLSELLHWPQNLGIEFRDLQIGNATAALLLWIDGIADSEALRQSVLMPLLAYRGVPSALAVERLLPIARRYFVSEMEAILPALLRGHVALFAEGWAQALILDIAIHSEQVGPPARIFGRDMRKNLALLRRWAPDPHLVACEVRLHPGCAPEAALLFRADTASHALVRLMRIWARRHLTSKAIGWGQLQPMRALFGLLPRLNPLCRPDLVAILLEAGYVALVLDRSEYVYMAPVTLGALIVAPGDAALRYPLHRVLVLARLTGYLLVLLLPALVVGLLNYHVEMIPTAFLLAVAATREAAPFSTFFEVLLLEIQADIGRAASARFASFMPFELIMIGTVLTTILTVQSGFVGPLPALAMLIGLFMSLALPNATGMYLVRIWRFYLVVGAAIFGFFGLTVVVLLLLTYLCQAHSWGVPCIGPAGGKLRSGEGLSSHRPGSSHEKEVRT